MALPTVTHTYRLAAEPELKISQSGTAVVRVRLAANANRKNDHGEWERADELFINATAFGDQAQAIADANLPVGQEVLVTGRLRTNSWENEQGEKRNTIEMRLDSLGVTIRPPRQQGGSAPSAPAGGWQAARPQQGYDPAQHAGDPSMPPF